jgi:hypothetical protein
MMNILLTDKHVKDRFASIFRSQSLTLGFRLIPRLLLVDRVVSLESIVKKVLDRLVGRQSACQQDVVARCGRVLIIPGRA